MITYHGKQFQDITSFTQYVLHMYTEGGVKSTNIEAASTPQEFRDAAAILKNHALYIYNYGYPEGKKQLATLINVCTKLG